MEPPSSASSSSTSRIIGPEEKPRSLSEIEQKVRDQAGKISSPAPSVQKISAQAAPQVGSRLRNFFASIWGSTKAEPAPIAEAKQAASLAHWTQSKTFTGREDIFDRISPTVAPMDVEIQGVKTPRDRASASLEELAGVALAPDLGRLVSQEMVFKLLLPVQERLVLGNPDLEARMDPSQAQVTWTVSRDPFKDGAIVVKGQISCPLHTIDGASVNAGLIKLQISVDTLNWTAEVKESYQDLEASFDFTSLTAPTPEALTDHVYPGTPGLLDLRSGVFGDKSLFCHHVTYSGRENIMHLEAATSAIETMQKDGVDVHFSAQQLRDAPRWIAHTELDSPDAPIRSSVTIDGEVVDLSNREEGVSARALVGRIWDFTQDLETTYAISRILTQGPLNDMYGGISKALGPEAFIALLSDTKRVRWTLEKDEQEHIILKAWMRCDLQTPMNGSEAKMGEYEATAVFDCTDWTADLKIQLMVKLG